MKDLVAVGLAVGLAVAVIGTAILASAASLLGVGGGPAASSAATAQIPTAMLTLYQQAAATCPGLPWTILAAIGTIESDNGQSNLPGVHSGANAAGAEGPMQFEPAPSPPTTSRCLRAARIRRALRPDRRRLRCSPPPLRRRRGRRGRPLRRRVRLQPLVLLRGSRFSRWRSPTRASSPVHCGDTGIDDSCGSRGGLVGPVPDRHAVRLGRRDAGRRLRLFGPRAGRLRRGRGSLPRVAQDQYDATPKLAPAPSWPRATWCSSAAALSPSTTSASTWVWSADRTSWSMLRTQVPTCAPSPFLGPRVRPSGPCSTSGRRDRSEGRGLQVPHVARRVPRIRPGAQGYYRPGSPLVKRDVLAGQGKTFAITRHG